MDYNNMEAVQGNDSQPKRPNFITVLCIITWVGCAFAIFGGIIGYFTTKAQCATMDSMGSLYENNPFGGSLREAMDKACEHIGLSTTINVLCGLICLLGSILMWQLKKIGFFIYAVAELAPVVSTVVLGAGGIFGAATAVFTGIIAVVWVVLYAVNLKHMR
jgi:hypothetical protein